MVSSGKKPVYKKMDPITHCLERSDLYIGNPKKTQQPAEWVVRDGKFHLEKQPVYSDGLWRIFMEPVSNVIDNCWRSKQAGIECKKIRVDITQDGLITIWNDGQFIPIEINEESNLYNPELIFGNLMTSSNYDDTEERLSSGRNGLGVKLTNVFSNEFSVECGDPERGVVYKQTWKNHMREVGKPSIKKKKTVGYTCVSFRPDLSLFDMESMDDTILGLFYKTCLDMAMIVRIPVLINGEKKHIKSFKDYVQLYPIADPKLMVAWDNNDLQKKKEEALEVVIVPSFDEEFHEIAFVNGIYNREGGTHSDAVGGEFFKGILHKLNKNRTTHLFTIKDVRPYFMIFVNAVLVNPTFSNQSKTRLNSPTPKVQIEARHIQNVCTKWGFMEKMNDLLKMREMSVLKKTEKKQRGYHRIEGLDHANKAGSKDSKDCTLILCEGLSAKTYAVTGLDIGWNGKKGRDWFGIFALRGKLLNVRNATNDSISSNKEITSIIQALNIKHRVDYTNEDNFSSLSYGKVMIITDADVDGLHIASLILNLFHVLFPSLLKREDPFLYWMMTPIAKIFKSPSNAITFYNDSDYQKALQELKDSRFKVKYYKGLGTSSDQEVKETFGVKVVSFQKDDDADKKLTMVFSKTASNDRKRWMELYDATSYETPETEYPITRFIDQEHIKFSIDDCKRNIPNLFDGLKLSQRKILYSVFKKNLVAGGKSLKVAQLAGFVAETSNYHHGEQCLYDTITRMAQDFVGSNNIPLLAKDGQFGSRIQNGKDAANGRYIFTKMLPLTRILFPEQDDCLVPYTLDDGDFVEPDYYVPILPMILVNGCKTGIGSGWSSNVPFYNPLELVEAVRSWLKRSTETFEFPSLIPYYQGFTGTIEQVGENKFRSCGVLQNETDQDATNKKKKKTKSGETHRITEIPIDISIDRYKDYLEKLLEEKKLKSLKNYSSPNNAVFCFTPAETFKPTVESMNLTSDIHLTNMVLFTDNGKLQKYDTLGSIFEAYCEKRYSVYEARKKKMLKILEETIAREKLRHRFLEDVMTDKVIVFRRTEENVLDQLRSLSYPVDTDLSFLLSIPVKQFTTEQLSALEKKIRSLEKEWEELKKTTIEQMWNRELDSFVQEYEKFLHR